MEWTHLGGFIKIQSVNSVFTGSLIRLGEAGKTSRLRNIEVYIIIYQIIVYPLWFKSISFLDSDISGNIRQIG